MAPICLAMGLPIDVIALLIAVETIPDIFRTIGNVTADVAVTAMVARLLEERPWAAAQTDTAPAPFTQGAPGSSR
jgi:Na+/H+-dicarboxylate symporter